MLLILTGMARAGAMEPAAALPIGSVTELGPAACPPALGPTATCARVEVSCDGVADLGAVVAVTEPLVEPRATVFLHGPLGGTRMFEPAFSRTLGLLGYRAVSVAWDQDWQQTDAAGLREAACRPATLLAWSRERHLDDDDQAFCGLGHSGGAAAFAFGLSWYGTDALLDHVVLSGGPVFSRVDRGCSPEEGRIETCEGVTVPWNLSPAVWSSVDAWTGVDGCGSEPGPDDDETRYDESILADGARLSFPGTRLDFWSCADDVGGAAGQGALYADAVTSETARHCATTCFGERAWSVQGSGGFYEVVDTIVDQCVPRHGA